MATDILMIIGCIVSICLIVTYFVGAKKKKNTRDTQDDWGPRSGMRNDSQNQNNRPQSGTTAQPGGAGKARFCPYCGGETHEGGSFCPYCGRSLSK